MKLFIDILTMLSTIIDEILLQSIVQYMFPSIKNIYLKALIGICIRLIHILALKSIDDKSWLYECKFNIGCNEYNMIMEYIRPYKMIIQAFATLLIQKFNNAMKELDISELRQTNATLIQENETIIQTNETIIQTNVTLIQENETIIQTNVTLIQENETIIQTNVTMQVRIDKLEEILYEHTITIPEDYIHEMPIDREHRIAPLFDIHEEFKRMQHPHLD